MPDESIRFDVRRHGVVLAKPFAYAFLLVAAGILVLTLPWPVPVLGAALTAVGAGIGVSAVWRWDRTRFVVTTEKAFIVQGVVRRRARGVRLARVDAVEVEQTLLGRLLGYGTVIAGALQVDYVPRPRDVAELLG